MLRILGIPSLFGNARGRAADRRSRRAHQPCVIPLEARALLASFQWLGANTNAAAVSAVGSVVVGNGIQGPMYWTQSTGPVYLRDSSGNIYPGLATGISGDGSVIVGDIGYGGGLGGAGAFRWANGIAAPIPQLANGYANSVSTDGTIIAGDVPNSGGWSPYTLTGANLAIIPLPSGDYSNQGVPGSIPFIGTTMSANGAVVAGNPSGGFGGSPLGTWQLKNGTLIQSPGNTGYATAVSPDGSVVVGSTGSTGAGGNTQAFEWTNSSATSHGVVTPLPWPAGYVTGSATAVSTDGATIVGEMSPPGNGGGGGGGGGQPSAAFIWNQATGVQNLQQVLISDGLGSSLTGWTLTAATAITPDGSTIVGNGIDPQGKQEGWIATLNTPPTLQSISVTPNGPSIPIGTTQQFTATGTYSNNSTENITGQVTWASAAPSVATISATGLATALAIGTSSITASLGGVAGATMLKVTVTTTPILQSITLTPASASIAVGATQQFFATGRFSDNSTENITSQVTWTSARTVVATISSAGLARGVATGPSSITASLGGVTGEAMLTVTRTSPPRLFRTNTLLTATPRSLTVGQTVTLTATVKATGPVSGSPSGIVTFIDNGTKLGMIRLSRGKAKLKTSRLYLGTNRIQVIYSGDNYFNGGKSTFLVETVVKRSKKAK